MFGFFSPRPEECVIGSYFFFVSFYFYIFQGANLLRPLLNQLQLLDTALSRTGSVQATPVYYFRKSKKKQKNTKPEELIQHFFQCVKGALPLIQQLQHHRIYTRPVVRWNPWTKTIESHLHLKLHRGHHVERRSTKGRHFPMIKPLHSSLTLEINLQKFSFFFNFKCLKKSSPFVFSPANSPRMKIKLSVKPISEQLQTQELFCFSFPLGENCSF